MQNNDSKYDSGDTVIYNPNSVAALTNGENGARKTDSIFMILPAPANGRRPTISYGSTIPTSISDFAGDVSGTGPSPAI